MSEIKQPQDHKTSASEPFAWKAPNGKKVVLTPFGRLPAGVFRKARSLNELEQTFTLIEAGTDEAGLEVIDNLALEDLNLLFEGWAKDSGIEIPQS